MEIELENQQLKESNKNLIAEYEKQIAELKQKYIKTEGSVAINSLGVNILVTSDLKNNLPH